MLNVTGKTKIFRKDFDGRAVYSTTISNKKEDGTYENMYISVQFKKGMETEGIINITSGFLTFFKSTATGLPKVKLVVLDYTSDVAGDFMTVDDSELPF